MWNNKQILQLMNMKLSDHIDYDLEKEKDLTTIQFKLSKSDLENFKRIENDIGLKCRTKILRIALRSMFFRLGY